MSQLNSGPEKSPDQLTLSELLQTHLGRERFSGFAEFVRQAGAADVQQLRGAGFSLLYDGAIVAGALRKTCLNGLLELAEAGSAEARELLQTLCDRRAIFPGSFDPFTIGHKDLVTRAARVFDEVIVAVGYNPAKAGGLFSLDERLQIIREAVADIPGNIKVTSYQGLTVNYATSIGCRTILRGVRGTTDFEAEMETAHWNTRLSRAKIVTLFLPTSDEQARISSSVVRNLARMGEDVSELTFPLAARLLRERLATAATVPVFGQAPAPAAPEKADTQQAQVESLRKRWNELIPDGGLLGEKLFDAVVAAYSDPRRHYHNLEHLEHVLSELDRVRSQMKNPRAVYLAAFFHDFAYLPNYKENEERSVDFSRAALISLALGQELTEEVAAHVLTTKKHDPDERYPDSIWLIQADLAILGAEWPVYEKYFRGIREEYCRVAGYSEEEFRAGRLAALERLEAKQPLFAAEPFNSFYEARARANIEREKELLRRR
jgi:pantetheine-phosphate adenylyltransferase